MVYADKPTCKVAFKDLKSGMVVIERFAATGGVWVHVITSNAEQAKRTIFGPRVIAKASPLPESDSQELREFDGSPSIKVDVVEETT